MSDSTFIPCFIPQLKEEWVPLAAELAHIEVPHRYPAVTENGIAIAQRLAVDMGCWWGDDEKVITVAFESNTKVGVRSKVLEKANAWSQFCNKRFEYSKIDPMVRVGFGEGGYWSYLGTDILGIPRNERTMNLQGFTLKTPESEWDRVVKHEFGHTLGFPHEHMRAEIVAALDVERTVKYFQQTQGWSRQETMEQVLTPISNKSIRGTINADDTSIMCYQLPGSITKDGKPIRGGEDINELDARFIATIYPKAVAPPVGPISEGVKFTIELPTGLPKGSYELSITPRQ
jgi:hypothetical protein